jgi:transcriptional regulator with XRE-family HTH domain
MTTSQKTWVSIITDESQPLTPGHIGYFQGRLRTRLYSKLMKLFLTKQENTGFTRADLARRLGKRPEQVTRWLAGPGNLKIDTLSDLLLAMGHELEIEVKPIETRLKTNHAHELAQKNQFNSQALPSSSKPSIVAVDEA